MIERAALDFEVGGDVFDGEIVGVGVGGCDFCHSIILRGLVHIGELQTPIYECIVKYYQDLCNYVFVCIL